MIDVGERADIKCRDRRAGPPFNAAPADIEHALEFVWSSDRAHRKHDLLDFGPRVLRLLADHRDIHRRLAPAINIKAKAQDFSFNDGAGLLLRAKIRAGQENLTDADCGRRVVWPVRRIASRKKSCGTSTRMPAPSPVLPSASTAPRCQTFFSALMPISTIRGAAAIDRHDEPDAAGIMFVRGIIGMGCD